MAAAATTGAVQPRRLGRVETQLSNSKWCAMRLLPKDNLERGREIGSARLQLGQEHPRVQFPFP